MKYYIFLDIDGVLNDTDYCCACYEKNGGYPFGMNHVPFDPRALYNLMTLVQQLRKKYSVKIILSSTWRLNKIDTEIVKARLAEYGLSIDGITSNINMDRKVEIYDFLSKQEQPYDFVILDDDNVKVPEEDKNHMILVNREIGLSRIDIQKILNQFLKNN